MTIPKILTLNAKKIICPQDMAGDTKSDFSFDIKNYFQRYHVVKQMSDFDECPFLHQLIEVQAFRDDVFSLAQTGEVDTKLDMEKYRNGLIDAYMENHDDWLLDKLVVLDFDDLFKNSEIYNEEEIKYLFVNGFNFINGERITKLMPFDKSGNMARKSRITFIAEKYMDEMNKRLNLELEFSKEEDDNGIQVFLSKYYAYRGLYLTSSQRVEHDGFKLSSETVVIIPDQRLSDSGKPLLGKQRDTNLYIQEAIAADCNDGKETQKYSFNTTKIEAKNGRGKNTDDDFLNVDTPFDGIGFVSFEYADKINEALEIKGASSFQIRMPFTKGVVHKVDFRQFIMDCDKDFKELRKKRKEENVWIGQIEKEISDLFYGSKYEIKDAFGIKRDLRQAQIILTKSMFKGFDWIEQYYKDTGKDPMEFYCKKMDLYNHALYIVGTDLPYGKTHFTHLSYQMINTLDFTDEQFERVVKKHTDYIEKPIEFLNDWDSSEAIDFEKSKISRHIPTWQKAINENEALSADRYISRQLDNTRKGLISRLARGKVLVCGQTRFLSRDLLPILATLLKDDEAVSAFFRRRLYKRCYIPFNSKVSNYFLKQKNNKASGFVAFFRSPHLSRSEQCILPPFVNLEQGEVLLEGEGKTPSKYKEYLNDYYNKYFDHLTGIVMVWSGSYVPDCLGGADFDGDLVSIVFDEDVVDAVKKGCYGEWKKTDEKEYMAERIQSIVVIPSPNDKLRPVPSTVPYYHIRNTFSNSIGLLSNAAISIGQQEYGVNKNGERNSKYDGPKCSECTAYTGLEIDAAKNGIHPDIDEIRNCNIENAKYLKFKSDFEKKGQIEDYEKYEVAESEYGTKINELPFLYKKYSDKNKSSSKNNKAEYNPFIKPEQELQDEKEVVEVFAEKCNEIFNLNFRYRLVLKYIKRERKKGDRKKVRINNENLNRFIHKIYDSNTAIRILNQLIPSICKKIGDGNKRDKISVHKNKKLLNELNWQFQDFQNRERILEQIIGKSAFNMLSSEEKKLLCEFKQGGYKLLWFIASNDIRTCEQIITSALKNQEEFIYFYDLQADIEKDVYQFYDYNLSNAEGEIYKKCLRELKNLISEYKESLSTKVMVYELYELAKYNEIRLHLFWSAIDYKMIKECTRRKGQ